MKASVTAKTVWADSHRELPTLTHADKPASWADHTMRNLIPDYYITLAPATV